MTRACLFAAFGSLLCSCASIGHSNIAETPIDECENPAATCIRFENATDVHFDWFRVLGIKLVDVPPSAVTQYYRVAEAYPSIGGEGLAGHLRYIAMVIDYAGVPKLTPGRYTFLITRREGRLCEDGTECVPDLGSWISIYLTEGTE